MTVTITEDDDWDDPDDYDDRLMPPSREDDDLDDDWYDDRDHWEPDPEDAEAARWLAEEAEHFEKFHGATGVCDCKPPLRNRIAWWFREHRGRIASWLRNREYDEPPF